MGTTADLATFVVECDAGAISDKAREETKRAIFDVIGTTLAGSAEASGRIVKDFVRAEGANGAATVIGGGFRRSSSMAALANGTMAHALDYDDVGLHIGHPSVAVVPAALAVGEEIGANPRDIIDAVVLGFEVAGRIGEGSRGVAYQKGYHGTEIFGVFGAAAAAGRLLGLDVDAMRRAFGVAGSEAGGVRANFGTMTKPLHAGATGRSGVMAAKLAANGFTSDPNIIETKVGFGPAILGDYDLEIMTQGLGDGFMVEDGVDIKKYPCCYGNHPTVDGVLNVMTANNLSYEDIQQITIDTSVFLPDLLIYPRPVTGLQGKFSLQYNVAAAMVDRKLNRATFTTAHVMQERLQQAIDKVRMNPIHRASDEGYHGGITVHITTNDGRAIDWPQVIARGSHQDPLTRDELVAKFEDNARVVLNAGQIERVVDLVEHLDTQPSLKQLMDVLITESTAIAAV